MNRIETASNTSSSSQRGHLLPDRQDLIETHRINSWNEIADSSVAWAELVERQTSCTIFQTYEWHHSWWQAFGDNHELFVVLCHKNGQLVGVAPMMIANTTSTTDRQRKELRFIGCTNGASDYLDFIVDPDIPEALDAILKHISDYLPHVDRIHLSHYPSHADTLQRTVNYFEKRGSRIAVEFDQEAPFRLMGDTQDDKRTANKASLRRRHNYFQKSGELRFHSCASESEIFGYIETFFDQHIARRELTHSASQFLDSKQHLFYRDLVRQLFPHGWLRFDVVLFNEEPIAFHFGFEYGNKFYWYKPTFDVRYAKRSPGEVLMKFLLEDTIDRKLSEFDFTVGSEAFKYRYSNGVRHNKTLIVFHSFFDYWMYRSKIILRNLGKRISAARTAKSGNSPRQ